MPKRTALTAAALATAGTGRGSVVRGLRSARSEVVGIPVGEIAANPLNPPERSIPSPELAESIRAMGVLSPLLVCSVDDWVDTHGDFDHAGGVRWVVLDGHRRHAAAVLADVAEVPAIERAELIGQATELMLAANSNRLGLSPYEEALGFQRLVDKGMTQTQIARIQGIGQGQVAKRLKLLQLPLGIASQVTGRGGHFGVSDALRLLEDAGPEELEELAAEFITPDETWQTQTMRQLSSARVRLGQRRGDAKVAEVAADLDIEIVNPTEAFEIPWRQALETDDEIQAARDAEALVVGNLHGNVTYFTTEVRSEAAPAQPQVNNEAEARAAKKRRNTFMIDALADKAIVPHGTTEDLIHHALSGQPWDANVLKVAARWAVAAGLLDTETEWEKHSTNGVPKVSLAKAAKLVCLAQWAEAHTFHNYSYQTFRPAAALYELLTTHGYQPSEWENKKLKELVRKADK